MSRPYRSHSPSRNYSVKEPQNVLTSPAVITGAVLVYIVLLLLLLLAELGLPGLSWLRATNEVLILLALLFLPFLFLAASPMVRSIGLKISGQELHLELVELRDNVQNEIKGVETRFAAQVSTAEQALWPMLAGDDPSRERRWRDKQIIIGSKLDASQAFLAHFVARQLESVQGLTCITWVPNGGSLKNFADLKYHWIDLYIEYTGTACQYFNIDHRDKKPEELIAALNDFGHSIGVQWQSRLGASENYHLVIRSELAEAEGITTIEDLTRIASTLVFTADPEFLNRRDGYVGLRSAYDLDFRRVEPCQVTARYAMLDSGEADVFIGYETDPELPTPKLKVLLDPARFFPDYDAVPVVSTDALQHIPGLQCALDRLRNCISTKELTDVVKILRHRGSHPDVARELARGFLQKKRPADGPHSGIAD
jgi:glycine betaine/choline ABC-type transport system substrate-binding protein